MASAQVVETSVNTNNSPSQDYTTNPDDHSNHNIDSPGFKPFPVMLIHKCRCLKVCTYNAILKFVTSMVRCGLGMQQCAMYNATIQKTTLFEF